MKNSILFFALLAASLTACNKDAINTPMGDVNAGLPSKPKFSIPVDVNGIITKDFLSKDTIWMIPGVSFVKPGKTLTIEAGTYLVAGAVKEYLDPMDSKVHHIKGVLVVPKGAKIMAVGTASAPIVFTSDKAVGQRWSGDFGGLMLMGEAPTNQPANMRMEGLPQLLPIDITYGGKNAADNSGTLKYVRIEFAGYHLNENTEINGLTLGGVGSATVLENIQVSWGRDDGFEFLGGTVNAKNLVALSNDDDDFDFDYGYTGTITNGLSLKDPNSTFSTSNPGRSDSNGLESDNNGYGAEVLPFTRPTLKNFTFLGYADADKAKTNLKFGNRWRRKSSLNITNSIIAGYGTGAAFENIGPNGNFSNNVVHAYTAAFVGTVPGTGNQQSITGTAAGYLNLAGGNDIFYTTATSLIFDPANLRPNAGSHAYGDGSTTYKGAFHPKQAPWTIGWTQFTPKSY
ncbi:hypothetical protein [Sphingobacterium lactis]|uniref:T9SS C-terminal target domain-containing protein n=1 Tax=Sphingobacterium lactis TaxID=797291 RepID=A0A1H5YUF3_9SPHI|nr:hypothetical protein [Sphingobacterium lactis]SEG27430.1 hypothetical protein SAMN05421877_106122 [Sphingobacterium lactis]